VIELQVVRSSSKPPIADRTKENCLRHIQRRPLTSLVWRRVVTERMSRTWVRQIEHGLS